MLSVGNYKDRCPNCESEDLDYVDEGFIDSGTYCISYNCMNCKSSIVEQYYLQYFASGIIAEPISVDDTRIKPLFKITGD